MNRFVKWTNIIVTDNWMKSVLCISTATINKRIGCMGWHQRRPKALCHTYKMTVNHSQKSNIVQRHFTWKHYSLNEQRIQFESPSQVCMVPKITVFYWVLCAYKYSAHPHFLQWVVEKIPPIYIKLTSEYSGHPIFYPYF